MNVRGAAMFVMASALLAMLLIWLFGHQPLARIASTRGTVERDTRASEQAWRAAHEGDGLELGDAVRTGPSSSADVLMRGGTKLHVEPDTILRLLSEAPGKVEVQVVQGSAELEAGPVELTVSTPRGPIRMARGARMKVREQDANTWVRVAMGRAQLGWEESARELVAGQQADSAARPALSSAAAAPETDTRPAVEARVQGGAVQVVGAAPRTLLQGAQQLPVGTHVRVSGDSSLELTQAAGGRLVTEGQTELLVGDGAQVATRVLSGQLRASAGKVPVEIEVPGGRLVLLVGESAASGRLQVSGESSQVQVERGSVLLSGSAGEQRLTAGQEGTLQARPSRAEPPASAARSGDKAPPVLSDMVLPAGVSTTVHDPAPPTAILIDAGTRCRGELRLEQQRAGRMQEVARGAALLAWFPEGASNYRVHCIEGSSSKLLTSGRVRVQRDAALRRVTQRAPELELTLDGRKYKTLYQTVLPRIHIRPAAALAGRPLEVQLTGPSLSRTLSLTGAGLTLESGELKEGDYELRIDAPAASGKPTTLAINYDNAAPAAYLDGASAEAQGALLLRGGVVEGSQLSWDGQPVPLDKAQRFELRAPLPQGARGVALWIKHPRLGSHHYVRRSPGPGATP